MYTNTITIITGNTAASFTTTINNVNTYSSSHDHNYSLPLCYFLEGSSKRSEVRI